jgi:hypothetical protein
MPVTVARNDAHTESNISATTAPFSLVCGQYGIDVMGSSFGTVTLQKLAGDGSTYITVSTYSANTFETQNLPAGTYRFGISSTTGVYIQMSTVVTI